MGKGKRYIKPPLVPETAPESYHVTDWEKLYESSDQNRAGRENLGVLEFRKSPVSPYDAASHDFLTRRKRMRDHPDRYLLMSVYLDLVDLTAQYDRPRRGYFIDPDGGPMSLKNLCIELDLYDEHYEPDEKLLKDVLGKLESLGLLEQTPMPSGKRPPA